jgi:hypothetical protein
MTATTAETPTLQLPATAIELHPGERYAGPVLDADGRIQHHLVLLPDWPEKRLTWQDAKAWAEGLGAQLPTRQEQALLLANCKPHLKRTWHWSCEEYEGDASCAWGCYFFYGNQFNGRKSYEGSAVAVRRLIP